MKQINESFKKKYSNLCEASEVEETLTPQQELRKALENKLDELESKGTLNIKDYEIGFQDVIENLYPDKEWWEVTDCNIFMSLFNSRQPEETIMDIIANMKVNEEYQTNEAFGADTKIEMTVGFNGERNEKNVEKFEFKDIESAKEGIKRNAISEEDVLSLSGCEFEDLFEESLKEAANPENAEVNELIRKILERDSNAVKRLEKMGYIVNIDTSARKEFGREYFGDQVEIINPETGRSLHANSKHSWRGNDTMLAGTEPWGKKGPFHVLKKGRYGAEGSVADPASFDFKNYLDTPLPEKEPELTNYQQFKKDKEFLKDKEYEINRIDKARERVQANRDRLAARNKSENLTEGWIDDSGILGEVGAWYIDQDLKNMWTDYHESDPVMSEYSNYKDWYNDTVANMTKTNESLKEDTVKTSKGKWTNKGDTGKTHGTFNTKKEADAQRRAMFANGFKNESTEDDTEEYYVGDDVSGYMYKGKEDAIEAVKHMLEILSDDGQVIVMKASE